MPKPIRNVQSFPFNFGIKEGKDEHQLQISELKKAENCRYRDENSIALCKNFGNILNLPAEINSLESINRNVYGFSSKNIFSVNIDEKKYEGIGNFLNADIQEKHIFQRNSDILNPDIFLSGQDCLMTFESENKIYYSIYDTERNLIVQSGTEIGNGIKPRIIKINNFTIITFLNATKNTINIWYKNALNEVFSTLHQVPSNVENFIIEEGSNGVLSISWRNEAEENKKIAFNLSTKSFADEEDDSARDVSFYGTDKNDVGNFYNFNKWSSFAFNDENYNIFFNEFRGYFIVNQNGRIVGKFGGKISPEINKEGVSFLGEVQRRGSKFYFPYLFQNIQRQLDVDELFNPIGLGLIIVDINNFNFLGSLSRLVNNQVMVSSAINLLIDEEKVSEFGFCEAPEISSDLAVSSNSLLSEEVTGEYSLSNKIDYKASILEENLSEDVELTAPINIDDFNFSLSTFKKNEDGDKILIGFSGTDSPPDADFFDILKISEAALESESSFTFNDSKLDTEGFTYDYYGSTLRTTGKELSSSSVTENSNEVNYNLSDEGESFFEVNGGEADPSDANPTSMTISKETGNIIELDFFGSLLEEDEDIFSDNNVYLVVANSAQDALDGKCAIYDLNDRYLESGRYVLFENVTPIYQNIDFTREANYVRTFTSYEQEEMDAEDGAVLFEGNISDLDTTINGNERIIEVPYTEDIEVRGYDIEMEVAEEAGWKVLANTLLEPLVIAQNTYNIQSILIETDTDNDRFNMIVVFNNLPDFGDTFPIYFKASEIGQRAETNFTYSSHLGNRVVFSGSSTIANTGFRSEQNETFNLEIFSGIPSTAALEPDNQTVAYLAVYKWVDSEGRIHRSRTSNFISVVIEKRRIGEGGDPASVPLEFSHLNLTNKENVVIEIYRSSFVASSISNSTFNKVTEIENKKDSNKEIFVDNIPQSNLKDRFFNFNIDQPNSGNISLEHKNRLYIAKNHELYYSEQLVFEREDSYTFRIDNVEIFKSRILGIASLDNAVIVFTEDQTFGFNIGSEALPIKSLDDHKNIIHKSIASFRSGITFQSDQGIFLLDRGLNVNFIGEDIKKFLGENAIVETKVQHTAQEIYMRLSNNTAIVFNYLYGKWSVEKDEGVSRFYINKNQYKFDSSGRVLSSAESGVKSLSVIETGDIPLSKVQSFQSVRRVWFSGDFGDWENLKVYFAYNNSPIFEDIRDIVRNVNTENVQNQVRYGSDQMVYAPEHPEKYQIMVEPRRRKIYAIKIRLELLSKNAVLSNIAFEIYTTNNFNKSVAQQRI